MNPNKSERNFLENLYRKDPKWAVRYLEYKKQKAEWMTSAWGYNALTYKTLKRYVDARLDEAGLEINDREVYLRVISPWAWYEKHKGKNPSHLFDILGIKTLDDLILVFSEFVRNRESPEYQFDVFLSRAASRIVMDPTLVNAKLEHEEFVNGLSGYIYGREAYYRDQYRRLERERMTDGPQYESVFLPLLVSIAEEVSENPDDDNGKKFLNLLTDSARFSVLVSPNEIKLGIVEALDKCSDLDLIADFSKYKHKMKMNAKGRSIYFSSALQLFELTEERKNMALHEIPDFIERSLGPLEFGYGGFFDDLKLYIIGAYFDGLPQEHDKRLRDLESDIRIAERKFKSEASKDKTEEDDAFKKYSLNNRYALYLLRVYRRNRQMIDDILDSSGADDSKFDENGISSDG